MPKLIEIAGEQPGRIVPLYDMPLLFGNADGAHHRVHGADDAEYCVRVFTRGDQVLLVDLSATGTCAINGQLNGMYEAGKDLPLKHGDTITLGNTVLRLEMEPAKVGTVAPKTQQLSAMGGVTRMMPATHIGDPLSEPLPSREAPVETERPMAWQEEPRAPAWPRVAIWSTIGAAVIATAVYAFFGFREARKPLIDGGYTLVQYKPGQFWQYTITSGEVERLKLTRGRSTQETQAIKSGEIRIAIVKEMIEGQTYFARTTSARIVLEDGSSSNSNVLDYFYQDEKTRNVILLGRSFGANQFQWLEQPVTLIPGDWKSAIASSYQLEFQLPTEIIKELARIERMDLKDEKIGQMILDRERFMRWADQMGDYHSEGTEIVTTGTARYRVNRLASSESSRFTQMTRVEYWAPAIGAPVKIVATWNSPASSVTYEAELARTNVSVK
ncbi:MAG TPA: FHA domain-containing protein [Fimbriimonadaceae bacterium]|nr:FHA domain-containing protein [Fimbriimonadaceae bacterium]